jgi:hypothetical protein
MASNGSRGTVGIVRPTQCKGEFISTLSTHGICYFPLLNAGHNQSGGSK